MKKLLVTGYFGPRTIPEPETCINPSGQVAERLHEKTITVGGINYGIEGQVINTPVTERAVMVRDWLASGRYAAHLALAVTSRSSFRLVRQVNNMIDTTTLPRHMDGQIRQRVIDAKGAPDAITNISVDFDKLLERLTGHGWSAEVVADGGEGFAAAAYAQIYYNGHEAPKSSVLAMNVPSTPEFAEWNQVHNGRFAEATLDLSEIEAVSQLALATMLEPRQSQLA